MVCLVDGAIYKEIVLIALLNEDPLMRLFLLEQTRRLFRKADRWIVLVDA